MVMLERIHIFIIYSFFFMESGIYIIYSNTNPKKYYIGSAVNLEKRYLRHLSELRKNKHFNYRIQNHVNQFGLYDIIFQVIEYCLDSDLIAREQFYIDLLQPTFNILPKAGSRAGSNQTDIVKVKISRRLKHCKKESIFNRYRRLMKVKHVL